jgi:rod shape-determining protein MreD
VRRIATCAVLVPALVLLQLMLVDRVPLPAGGLPDVALLAVIALGLTQGPATGMLVGFCTGLCLDLAPPGGHLAGQSALTFCAAGYLCGRLENWVKRPGPRLLAAALTGAVAAEGLQAAVGLLAGEPGASMPAVRHALLPAVLYDMLLTPVVLFAAVLVGRWRVRRAAGNPVLDAKPAVIAAGIRRRGGLAAAQPRPRLRWRRAGRASSAGGLP